MAVADDLRVIKERRGITVSQWSAASGVPQDTINKILSGSTRNPSYQTVCDLITAVGGHLDILSASGGPEEPHAAIEDMIRQMYEAQIEDIQKANDAEIRILKESHEAHLRTKDQQIAELIRSKHILAIALTVAIIILLIVLGCDLSNGSVGMIRY